MEVLLIMILTAAACSILGVFVVLRQLAMVTDAITHTVLLGIVVTYFLVRDIDSPWLFVGAAIVGVLTTVLIEVLLRIGIVQNDAAVGVVFTFLFALAIVLVSKYARNVHIDTDTVLMGEVIFAPINRTLFLGVSVPKALIPLVGVLLLNTTFVSIFYKELKLTTFDATYAQTLGFTTVLLQYALMSLVSLTAVVAFDIVGALLVVAFFITPVASAYLWVKSLGKLFVVALIYGVLCSVIGYYIAVWLNVSVAGMCAVVSGILLFATVIYRLGYQRWRVHRMHLYQKGS